MWHPGFTSVLKWEIVNCQSRTCSIRKVMADTEWIFFLNLELANDQGGLYLLKCAISVSQNSLYPFLSKSSQR